MSPRRVAIYGGSFDPPHLGHVLSIAWTLAATDTDEVWIVPTWNHAFGKKHGATFEQRMSMCVLAFECFRHVEVLDVERRLGGVSRTLETLQILVKEHPSAAFRLLVGADVLPTTDRWYRWEDVVKIAPPLVVGREGYPAPKHCPISIPNINSTEIRSRLAGSDDLSGLVPKAVLELVRSQDLYRGVE